MQHTLTSIPLREVLRYALGTKPPDPLPGSFLQQAQDACQKVLSCAQPKYHYQIFQVQPLLDSLLTGDDIRRHLSGCSTCVLLCATLGPQVDAPVVQLLPHQLDVPGGQLVFHGDALLPLFLPSIAPLRAGVKGKRGGRGSSVVP